MDEFLNSEFQESIKDNLEKIPSAAREDFYDITHNFSFKDIYIMGGFVRDSILKVLYNYIFPINDLDILVDNPRFAEIAKKYSKESFSRFGGLKFKYPNFSMDIFSMDNVFFLKNNLALEKNIENVLKGCDLTTSALAYNLESHKIYNVGTMEDIYKKTVNVNDHSYIESAPTISRLILHADKMGFKIGESGINYIKKNYSPNLDKKIMDFLNYKDIGHLFPLIKENIRKVLGII
jgi:tRNA nucleotidyltransferase/poly(A) polymerase